MTFDDIVSRISKKTGLTSAAAITRIGETINDVYKEVTSSIGLNVSRHFEAQANASIGSQLITFTGIEKVNSVIDKSTGRNRALDDVSLPELNETPVTPSGDQPTKYAIYRMNAGSVQIKINSVPQTAFLLYAPGFERASTLSGAQEPAFSESFHDVIYWKALYEELLKQEKLALAKEAKGNFEDRMGDLRIFIAKSPNQDIYQGKRAGTTFTGSSMSGGSGGGATGSTSYTQTGLITFDRSGAGAGSAPFAVVVGAGKVSNLDADLLDSKDWNTVGVLPDAGLGLTDVTTNDVSSTKHGFAPKSPADATKFLNGAATPAYAQVKDSDLSTSDVVTNNVSSTKHGFAPKSPASATQFLNGAATPAFAAVKDSDLALTDITTNNVSTSAHGFTPKAPNDITKFLRGDASWAGVINVCSAVSSTGTVNDLAPTTLVSGVLNIVPITSASDLTLTGLSSSGLAAGTLARLYNTGAGNVFFKHANAGSSAANRFTNIATSGDTPISKGFVEFEFDGTNWRLHAHEQGGPITATYAGGNFTGSGSMTWTVDSGDVTTLTFYLRGRMLTVTVALQATSVGGTLNNSLNISNAAYGGFSASKGITTPCVINDAAAAFSIGQATTGSLIGADATHIFVFKVPTANYTAATNTTQVEFITTFEVS